MRKRIPKFFVVAGSSRCAHTQCASPAADLSSGNFIESLAVSQRYAAAPAVSRNAPRRAETAPGTLHATASSGLRGGRRMTTARAKTSTNRSTTMSYVDGFVIPVPTGKKAAYQKACTTAAEVFKEYGATRIVECWGDDVPAGKVTDFKGAVKAEPGETVVFSWIVWPSKELRDQSNEKMKNDPRMKMTPDMPFDGKRMIYGGFEVLLDTSGELRH